MSIVTLFGRQVVRSTPYAAQKTYIQQAVLNNATLSGSFDLALALSDRNQLADGGTLLTTPVAVGPLLDVSVFSDHVGTLEVFITVDQPIGGGAAAYSLTGPLTVTANVPSYITALRIPARYVTAQFTNTGGATATVDFGAFARSN